MTRAHSQRIVVATPEVLGAQRAGPAIRAWHFATALSTDPAGHDVTLVGRVGTDDLTSTAFRVTALDDPNLARVVGQCDIIIVQGDLLSRVPAIAETDAVVVADLYDPYQLEALEQTSGLRPDHRRRAVWAAGRAIDDLLRRGDAFLCAGGRQRDFWLGALAAAGRVNEATHATSPNFADFLLDVPFGVDDELPRHTRASLRDVVPGIGPDDAILWWGGGIYAWLDPTSLIEAVGRIADDHPDLRLVFAGARHPNPDVGETPAARAARAYADTLGLTGRHVFFLDWIPYEERASFLLEADVVVSTHLDHLEAAFSYRTRLLDALWAGRAIIATAGDALSDEAAARGAGIAVPPHDVGALATAIAELLDDDDRRSAGGEAAARWGVERRWSTVVRPLLEFCRAPSRAPDRSDPQIGPMIEAPGRHPPTGGVVARARRAAGRMPRPRRRPRVE